MSELALCDTEPLIALWVLTEFLLAPFWYGVSVDGDDLVLLVKQLDVLGLPDGLSAGRRCGFLLAEEDKSAVTLDVDRDAVECKSLGDGRLHLADGMIRRGVQVNQRAVLTVHDEVTVRSAALGDLDEVVDAEAAAPGWEDLVS